MWGPSLKAAKDASGAWTGAAQGFAKKNGVAVTELQQGAKDPVEAERDLPAPRQEDRRPRGGRSAAGGPRLALRGLNFPKRMSWDAWLDDGKGAFPFGRPIRWLVALLDGTVVPFVIYELVDGAKGKARVASGPSTFGHRFLPQGDGGDARRSFGALAELKEALRRTSSSWIPRSARARSQRGSRARRAAASLPDDHGLRAEWRDLVEYPTVLDGEVPAEFRSLPREVLETVLVHHQKYIPLPTSEARSRASRP